MHYKTVGITSQILVGFNHLKILLIIQYTTLAEYRRELCNTLNSWRNAPIHDKRSQKSREGNKCSQSDQGHLWNLWKPCYCCCSVTKLCPTLRPMDCSMPVSCPSLSPGVCSDSYPLSWWCYLTISSSAIHFSFCLQSFTASESFPMSQLFASGGQSIGVSASASVLPMSIQGWFPLGLIGIVNTYLMLYWRFLSPQIGNKARMYDLS